MFKQYARSDMIKPVQQGSIFELQVTILWKTCVFVPDRFRIRYNPNVVPEMTQG